MVNVFEYLEPSDYLKDSLKVLKEGNSSFSLRAWAKQLGMKSHAPLHDILNKKRKIPKNLVPVLIKSLKLSGKQREYFEALVDFQRAKSIQEKEFYQNRLKKLAPGELLEINDVEAYKYLTDPIHFILAEMTQLKNFEINPLWIKQHLRLPQNLKDISDIIDRLKRLSIIEEQDNKVIKNAAHIYTKIEIESAVRQNYHKHCSRLAQEQISKQELAEKEFNSICFNVEKKNLPQLKETIRDFINKTIEEFEAPPHQGDETYQLNIQLFSLSK